MRVAIPICRGRISPVFDVAQSMRLVEIEGRAAANRTEVTVRSDRARALAEHDVNLVICAGISREVGNALRAQGIEVISGICGSVDEVVDAYLACRLDDGRFVMPGGWNNHQEW